MVKVRIAILLLLCVLTTFSLSGAPQVAFTANPVSLFSPATFPEGLYSQQGVLLPIGDRGSVELQSLIQWTPGLADSIGIGLYGGLLLLGPLSPTYFNMKVDGGYLYYHRGSDLTGHHLLGVRLSPLVLGNPSYGYQDRIFTVGLLYDLSDSSLSVSYSTVIGAWFF